MTSDDDIYGERLRRALHREADVVMTSGDGLREIQERTRRRQTVPWVPFGIAAATAAVAGVFVGVVFLGDGGGRTDTVPAAPTASRSQATAQSPTPSGPAPAPSAPQPTGSGAVGGTAPVPGTGTTGTPGLSGTTTVPVYFLGNTSRGVKLYREFHKVQVTGGAVVRAALTAMTQAADDPDYRSAWAGTTVKGISRQGATLTVEMSRVPAAAATAAGIQQLVYTATAADRTATRVRITGAGAPASAFRQPFARAPQIEVVAPVWIIAPTQGARVGRSVTLSGDASVFEATVSIEVAQGSRVVRRTFAQASVGAPGRGTWSARVTLAPGSYTIRAYEASAEDGRPLFVDTKTITVR